MRLESLGKVEPFVTKDGSTIRELHHTELQSLAEATLEPSEATERHYHAESEEIYFVVKGSGTLGTSELRILCCCAPPYSDEDTFFS